MRLTEEQVRERLVASLVALGRPIAPRRRTLTAALGHVSGGCEPQRRSDVMAGLLLAGVRWTGEHYEEAPDAR